VENAQRFPSGRSPRLFPQFLAAHDFANSIGLVTAMVLAIASVTGLLHRAPTLLAFAGMLIALGLLFAGLSYLIVLDSDERQRLRARPASPATAEDPRSVELFLARRSWPPTQPPIVR
jgi:hypothetical protein